MPILLGERIIKIINYLVTYGESQEFGKLDIAINKYIPIIIHLNTIWCPAVMALTMLPLPIVLTKYFLMFVTMVVCINYKQYLQVNYSI